MDTSWETVSHKKNKKEQPLTKNEKKKLSQNMTKLEDLDPLKIRTSVYVPDVSENGDGISNGYLSKEKENKSPKKVNKTSKHVVPVTNTEVLKNMKRDGIDAAYSQSRGTFPSRPLLWLMDLCSYLDLQLEIDKKDEWTCSNLKYPSNLLSSEATKAIDRILDEISASAKRDFFLQSAEHLVTRIKTNQPTLGTRVVVQMCVQKMPQAPMHSDCIEPLRKILDSNRTFTPGFAPLLWCLGQAAYREKSTGYRILFDYLLHYVHQKNFATAIISFMEDILSLFKVSPKSIKVLPRDLLLFAQMAFTQTGNTANVKRVFTAYKDFKVSGFNQISVTKDSIDTKFIHSVYSQLCIAFGTNLPFSHELQELLLVCFRASPSALLTMVPFLFRDEKFKVMDSRLLNLLITDQHRLSSNRKLICEFVAALTSCPGQIDYPQESLALILPYIPTNSASNGSGSLSFLSVVLSLVYYVIVLLALCAAIISVFAFVPRTNLPAFVHPVQEFLEKKLVLYHVRVFRTDAQICWRKNIMPGFEKLLIVCSRNLQNLGVLLQDLYRVKLQPALSSAYQVSADVYFNYMHEYFMKVYVFTAYWVTFVVNRVLHFMEAHFPTLLETVGSNVHICTQYLSELIYSCRDYTNQVYTSFMKAYQ